MTAATVAKNLLIGLDSSTTACKAIVWDTAGNLIAEGRSPIPLEHPRPLWHEQPAEAWWAAAVESLRAVTSQIDNNRLAGLCISPQRETFVPVDQRGQPLRQAIIWMDERSGPLLPEIGQQLGQERYHQQTGKPLTGNLSLPKIVWIKENEPDIFRQAHKFLDVAGFLHHCLTGLYRTGWGCVDPMGLFDMQHHCWSEEVLAYLGIDESQLPQAYPPGVILGEITTNVAELTGLPAGLPVVAGVGDGQAAGLGANITGPGRAYLILGTSVISGTYTEVFQTNPTHRIMYGGIPNSYMLETALLGGGYTITWFVEKIAGKQAKFSSPDTSVEAMFEQAAQNISPGADGLMLVPYWNSVMNPYWDASASGIVVGWRGFHTLEHLYRAILEGIGFELRLHLQGVQTALETDIEKLIVMGGGSNSGLWCRIMADITGKPIYLSQTPDASSLGAAIQAAFGVGLFANMPAAARAMTRLNPAPIVPHQQRSDFYTQLYEQVYLHLFPALQSHLQNLTRLSESS
ncbi:MAG: xylulose kinase [Anaerolineae bacterium]|nr:xylulose kinase [Anaerolineae bacterium]